MLCGYLGLVLSCQKSLVGRNVKEKSKGGQTVLSDLKSLNISKYSLFHFSK